MMSSSNSSRRCDPDLYNRPGGHSLQVQEEVSGGGEPVPLVVLKTIILKLFGQKFGQLAIL